jgi:hypothetical protein
MVDQIEEQFERNAFKGISGEELDTTFQTLFKTQKKLDTILTLSLK